MHSQTLQTFKLKSDHPSNGEQQTIHSKSPMIKVLKGQMKCFVASIVKNMHRTANLLKLMLAHLSRRIGEVAGITLSAASMFDSTCGITIFCTYRKKSTYKEYEQT